MCEMTTGDLQHFDSVSAAGCVRDGAALWIHDTHCVELRRNQTLTCSLLLRRSQWNRGADVWMGFISLRSHGPHADPLRLPALASLPPSLRNRRGTLFVFVFAAKERNDQQLQTWD